MPDVPSIPRSAFRLAAVASALCLLGATAPSPVQASPPGRVAPAHRHAAPVARHPRHHVHRHAVIVAPVRPVPAVRPWYWGRVVAGVTIGTVIVASAAAVVPPAPSPDLCWFWTDAKMTSGYWSYCVPPAK